MLPTEMLYGAALKDITFAVEATIGPIDDVSNWLSDANVEGGESVMFGEPPVLGEVFELHKVERDIHFHDHVDGLSVGIDIFEYEQEGEQGYMFACYSGTVGATCDPFYSFTPRTEEAIGRMIAWFIHSFYGDWSKSLDCGGIPKPNTM